MAENQVEYSSLLMCPERTTKSMTWVTETFNLNSSPNTCSAMQWSQLISRQSIANNNNNNNRQRRVLGYDELTTSLEKSRTEQNSSVAFYAVITSNSITTKNVLCLEDVRNRTVQDSPVRPGLFLALLSAAWMGCCITALDDWGSYGFCLSFPVNLGINHLNKQWSI
jgi:hypothetical protein